MWLRFLRQCKRLYAIKKMSPREKSHPTIRMVASGHSSEALVAAYRRLYGDDLFAIFIGSPKWKKPIYDLAIASNHAKIPGESGYRGARCTIWMSGVFARGLPTRNPVAKKSALVILIGGINKGYKLDAERLGDQIEAMGIGHSTPESATTIIFSRRTPLKLEHELRNRFQNGCIRLVDRSDRAGFEEAMATATQYLVTPDSTTMICEACFANQPVTVFDLECINPNTKTVRFVDEFIRDHRINKFGESGKHQKSEPLDHANAQIVNSVVAIYNAWCAQKLK
jgi:mitochondrial fission protein ELM1